MTTQELLARARQARGAMALADTQTKDRALLAMAEELEADMALKGSRLEPRIILDELIAKLLLAARRERA